MVDWTGSFYKPLSWCFRGAPKGQACQNNFETSGHLL